MKTYVANEITIVNPSKEVKQWCVKNLIIPNPEYSKKSRMGLWLGNTPKNLTLYKETYEAVIIPYGALLEVYDLINQGEIVSKFTKAEKVDYHTKIPLRDYQQVALEEMVRCRGGILQSKAGSGKTQIGLAIAVALQKKTLWITHTKDLLTQSKQRAEQYIDTALIGTITEGKVNIGKGITFATVQTLSNLNLALYQNYWDCIIVDECHRVAGSATTVTQFSKVLEMLSARHKYGLSATVHRSDGLIRTTYYLIGQLMYTVPDEVIGDYVMSVMINPVNTQTKISRECLNTDGTLNYTNLISYLCNDTERNKKIVSDLIVNCFNYNLILSDRIDHLKTLMSMLPKSLQSKAVFIDGSMTSKKGKQEREKAIEDMKQGKKQYLFATYRLAKEGLDIPRLDRLYLVTPQKDYAVIVQSVGRIARTFGGKETPICYDYVDDIYYLIKSYKQRITTYKKCNCQII